MGCCGPGAGEAPTILWYELPGLPSTLILTKFPGIVYSPMYDQKTTRGGKVDFAFKSTPQFTTKNVSRGGVCLLACFVLLSP